MDKMDVYNEIVGEMFSMRFACQKTGDYSPIERKLQELLMTLNRHQADEIALYLRSCFNVREDLPTWQLLLNRGVELSRMQGIDPDDAFYGLLAHK